MPLTSILDQQIFYHEEGSATGSPPLVFLHGWTCDHTTMIPIAERFSQDHHWIALDLLGHGRSAKPQDDYEIETQARIAAHMVKDWAPSRPLLIGHSMGAQIAIEMATQNPGSYKGLVLMDPAPIIPHEKAVQYGLDVQRQLAKQDIPMMLSAFARRQIIKAVRHDLVDQMVDVMAATPAHVVKAAWDSLIDWDGESRFKGLRCPMLLISADKPLNRPMDLVHANPKLMTAQTAGAGHMQQYEVPDQIEAMIRRFIELLT